MSEIIKDKIFTQIQEVSVAAIMLKEMYDRGRTDRINEFAQVYLSKFQHLKDLLPKDFDLISIGNESNWIYKKPTDSYSNVRQICLVSMDILQNNYYQYKMKRIKEGIETLASS